MQCGAVVTELARIRRIRAEARLKRNGLKIMMRFWGGKSWSAELIQRNEGLRQVQEVMRLRTASVP